jgi:tetratricopeptide (TPR) repeat protein
MLTFLDRDPKNLNLLAECVQLSAEIGDNEQADALLVRHQSLTALPPSLVNLKGAIALATERYADAAEAFEQLRSGGHNNPAVRFNLAWAKAMLGTYEEALELLDPETISVSPRAPSLKIQMLHHLKRYDDGLAAGEELLAAYPDDKALLGALATLALDAERSDLARAYAGRGGNNPESQAALGILTLGEQNPSDALVLFDSAIQQQPRNPRAWIGRGLAQQALGEPAAAAEALDHGAALFGDHLGSWIAAGWGHVVAGDTASARARFEKAMTIDPNFSENHGGLAVLDLMAGDVASAERRADIALRLDRSSFGGALAKSLLLDRTGNAQAAQRVRQIALNTPIGPAGQTIAEAMARFGRTSRK